MTTQPLSKQTQKNWWIDAILFSSAVIAALSGIYFLFLPSGGYQGGRNPLYEVQILFDRHTWDDLHTWGGAAMIAAAMIHLLIHWSWVKSMLRRTWNELTGKCGCMNRYGRFNLIINVLTGILFAVTAVSGIGLFVLPGGRVPSDQLLLLDKSTWDILHTWAGTLLIVTALVHLAIHWGWVVKVTRNILRSVTTRRAANTASA